MAEAKTALVTGGAGFIGSHLVDRLLAEGYKVVVVDDLSTGKLKNLNPSAIFYHTDITRPSIQQIFEKAQPDLVFHLAAQVSVTNSSKDPITDAHINVLGTLRLLEASRHSGTEKFIFSSTGGALYGEPEVNPCTEDTPIAPLSAYGTSKYLGEQYVELYQRLYNLNHTTLRYANVFGPRQDPHGEAGVIAIFTNTMLEGKQPEIFGSGDQERDFLYVDDVVQANILAIDRGDGQAFNVGTGQGTSINRIFSLIRDNLKYRWEADYRQRRPGEVHRISLECSKAGRDLGWSPSVEIESGLRKTLEHFRKSAPAPV